MSLPDTIFILVLALIIFGPKRLPEIGRQIGKLLLEFRRASNDFKFQIDEELRLADEADKAKQAAIPSATPAQLPQAGAGQISAPQMLPPQILPPTTGDPVGRGNQFGNTFEDRGLQSPVANAENESKSVMTGFTAGRESSAVAASDWPAPESPASELSASEKSASENTAAEISADDYPLKVAPPDA